VKNFPVLVAIPGNQTFFREFALPPVAESRISEIVRYEARQQIPFPLEEVIWDYVHGGGSAGAAEMDISLIAIRRELIEAFVAMMTELGLQIEAIQTAPLALFNFIRYDIDPGETALVLDAGAKVTDFVVMDGKNFWFRPLPIAGEDFTRVLQQKFRMDFAQAEDLKRNMAQSKQADKIYQVIEPTVRNLTGEVQRTVGYYKSLSPNAQIKSVYSLGNAFRLPGLVKFISGSLGVDVTYLAGLTRTALNPSVSAENFAKEFPSLGVAVGLGLQGVGLGTIEMTLVPEALRMKKLIAKKRPIAAAGVGAVAVAVLASYFGASASIGRLGEALGEFKTTKDGVAANKVRYTKEEAGLPAEMKKLEAWSAVGAERGWAVDCLDKIGRLKGEGGAAVIGEEARVVVRQFYVSRYNPIEAMLPPVAAYDDEKDKVVVIKRGFDDDLGRAFKGLAAGASTKEGLMMAVLRGEILPSRRAQPDGSALYDVDLAPAQKLEEALKKVKGFENVKLGADFRRLRRKEPKLGPDGAPMLQPDGKLVTDEVDYYLFQITWTYKP